MNSMKHNAHPDYRSDIDGLRAVAILSVLVYHAFPSLLPGGFIGVDVFFVISGYLISTILFKSHEAGTFNYLDFYIRRARRIFPSLALVLAFSLAAGWWIFIPREFQPFGNQVAYGAGFTANILFIREAGYWDSASELKPLLHLWSLGVEEQYYLLWPLMIALFWRRSHNFLLIVIPIFLASFVLSVVFLPTMPEAVFYSPISRFWELMVGGLLAYLTLHQIPKGLWNALRLEGGQGWKRRANWISLLGLLLMIAGVAGLNPTLPFPGWWALLPTTGTFLLILAGADSWFNRKFLAHPWMVYVGLISYPLYLWHWPLLSFAKIISPEPSGITRLLLAGAAVLLAILTYHFVEIPIRTRMSGPRAAVYATVCVAALGGMGALAHSQHVLPYHQVKQIVGEVVSGFPGRAEAFPCGKQTCYRLGEASPKSILLAGDSNMRQYYPRVEYIQSQPPQSSPVVFLTKLGCPPIPQVQRLKLDCGDFGVDVLRYAQTQEISTVVLAADWLSYVDGNNPAVFRQGGQWLEISPGSPGYQQMFLSLERALTTLRGQGKRVYLVSNIPVGKTFEITSMLHRPLFSLDDFSLHPSQGVRLPQFLGTHGSTLEILRQTAAKSGVNLIEPMRYLCDDTRCPAFTPQGQIMYGDARHLNGWYVRNQVTYLDEIFNGGLSKSGSSRP